MEKVPNLINICPTNPIQVLNKHDFCVYASNDASGNKIKKIDVGTGAPHQRQDVY